MSVASQAVQKGVLLLYAASTIVEVVVPGKKNKLPDAKYPSSQKPKRQALESSEMLFFLRFSLVLGHIIAEG